MDRTYIESQHIVSRYLSGDLTVREAREFEKYCQENPDMLNSLPIPVRVKAKMARKPGAELDASDFDPIATDSAILAAGLQESEDDDDDDDDSRGMRGMPAEGRRWTVVLGVLLAVAIAGAAALWVRAGALEKQLIVSQRAVKSLQIRPPGGMQEFRIKPVGSKPSSPTINIGWPDPPQIVELRIDMSEGKYNTFLVTIDSVADGRALQFRRVARDSNGEVRIGLNSSAFGPGEYDLKLEGYTWGGQTVPSGWIRLGLK
jgi:hypothetical protein